MKCSADLFCSSAAFPRSNSGLQERVLDLQISDALAGPEVFAVQDAALAFHCRCNDEGIVPGKPELGTEVKGFSVKARGGMDGQ